MGVPKFFRYISERYPCLSETIKEHQIPEFDYLYLDMNGIIHTCSHPNDSDVQFRISEENIFKNIFHYIEVLFNMIQPQKLFFMAIDGVAPRAKINQQRSRRFKSAKEAEMQECKARKKGIEVPTEKRFDSNCITPGTLFMAKLNEQFKRFIIHKISSDDTWRKCKVLFSGSEVPGEGEHKIMDFIRYMKASKDYDNTSRHCLYGLDADLIMLGLCSHEPNFCLLREEVKFGKAQKRILTPEETKFCLLHLSLLREYISHEFSPIKDKLSFAFDLEKIIDDWILMGFLVGNDFIPHLPNLHIINGALPILYRAYMDVLPTLEGYINEAGILKLDRFEKFMEKLSRLDVEQFNEHYADLKYFESKRKLNESAYHACNKTEEEIASQKKTQNKDLDALIKSTTEMSLGQSDDDDMMDDESDTDMYTLEFVQHKRNYYMNKLEYENVDADVLRSQAEGYVRAIQWNLHYYYNGCCSWSWYYPHHYAPYISDIKDFKDLKLEFELGEPFLPFQQLLAVLPAHSKELLPSAFQQLLVEEDSPIINYYPHDFKTDLNGKRQEWEAVVLIPFIDEKLLLNAMQPYLSKLTLEEQERNKHGEMYLHSFTEENLNLYEATVHFPRIISHTQVSVIKRDDIFVQKENLVRGLSSNFDPNIYYPGFPILRHIKHTASLEKAKVKVFEQPSLRESMILHVTSQEKINLSTLALELLGKTVYVDWPHLKEALVIGIADNETKLSLINPLAPYDHNNLNKENMKGLIIADWNLQIKHIKETYMLRFGIDIGDTNVLLFTRPLLGSKYIYGTQDNLKLEKQWSELPVPYVYQTVVKNIFVYYKNPQFYKTIYDIFTPGTICFMLGHPYYGAMGEVLQDKVDTTKPHRIKISIKITKEPSLETIKQAYAQLKTRYMYGSIAAQRLGISSHLLSRITGTIYVLEASNEVTEVVKHNVGLNLKFNKKNEEIPGYTKKENGQWLYSTKAIELIRKYMVKCPDLFERLAKSVTNDVFQEDELFNKGSNELNNTIAWLKTELHGIESRACGTDIIATEIVQKIEEEIEKHLEILDTTSKAVFIHVKPDLLFKPGLHMRNLAPDPYSQNRLLDRICCVRKGYTVPLGSKGIIIGIQKGNSPADTMYDTLFDQSFIGGLSINGCSESRGYRLAITDFINISFGERMEHGNPSNESVECRKQSVNPASPNKKIKQTLKTPSQQMHIAKKSLEKISQNLSLSSDTKQYQPQFVSLHSSSKTTPRKTLSQTPPNVSNQSSEFQVLWNELYKTQNPSGSSDKVETTPVVKKIKQVSNNCDIQSPQDPSAFLKAMLKISDKNTQPNKQQSKQPEVVTTHQKAIVPQKLEPPPLVQQLFDRARRTEEKQERADSIWYCSQLLKYFSYAGIGMPKYNYFIDEQTGLVNAHITLQDARVFKGDSCTTHEQAAESAAKIVYKALNLDKASISDTKILLAPRQQQWYNSQQNSSWVQTIRPSLMRMCPPKLPSVPQSSGLSMQPNLFYPKWNQKLPSNSGFEQTSSYNQEKQQGNFQNKSKVKNSTAFVPLQAQKKSRNVRFAIKETNQNVKKNIQLKTQQQKNEGASSKKEKPEIVNKVRENESSDPQLPQQQQSTKKLTKPRKSRLAAKFNTPPSLNGGEPQ